MDPLLLVSAFLVAALLALVIVVRYYQDRLGRAEVSIQDANAARRRTTEAASMEAERLGPFLARYPFDPRSFRFVGAPVDGVQFEADRVIFVQFTGTRRAPLDERVRENVRAGRVEWVEVPLDAPAHGEAPSREGLS